MRDIQLRLTENVRAVGWTVQWRIGRTDGADRRAILGELRTASENLADHLDARFGSVISSAFQAGKELYAVAGATLFKGDEKQGYLTRSRQFLMKAQIDPKLAAPLHEFVSGSDNYDAAFGIVETVRAAVLRDMDQRLMDTPTFRRLRSNAFQAGTNLVTAALSGRADMQRSNQLFERARIFADNIRVEVPGFAPPAVELARIPADGTDSSKRLAIIWDPLFGRRRRRRRHQAQGCAEEGGSRHRRGRARDPVARRDLAATARARRGVTRGAATGTTPGAILRTDRRHPGGILRAACIRAAEVYDRGVDTAEPFEERMRQLREGYIAGLPARLETMRMALRGQDRATLQSEAHRLAGTGMSYGLPQLTTWGREVERKCKAGASLEAFVVEPRPAVDDDRRAATAARRRRLTGAAATVAAAPG